MEVIYNDDLILEYIEEYKLGNYFDNKTLKNIKLFKFFKDELVCSKDRKVEYMYFLVEGKIKTYTFHENGKSLLLRFSYPLSIFGDLELFTDYLPNCNTECVKDSIFLAIDIDFLRRHNFNNPEFLKFIIQNLSNKLYNTTNSVSINLLYPVKSRFSSYLLSMSDYYDNPDIEVLEIILPQLTEVALLLGTSYRHLNRVIKDFINKKIIKKDNNKFTIIDRRKLVELSDGNIYED